MTSDTKPLWQPSRERVERANLTEFRNLLEREWGVALPDYGAVWRFSIDQMDKFWHSVWDYGQIIAPARGERVLENPGKMPGTKFFPDAHFNFAENLLRRRDGAVAIVFRGEDKVKRSLTFAELHDEVSRLAAAFRDAGVTSGDRVAGYLPNMPETIIAMLATASLGAVWSSCSPDFGAQGVLDRFGQIEPKILVAVEGYHYNGKSHDCLAKLKEIVAGLPTLQKVVTVSYTRDKPPLDGIPNAVHYADFVAPHKAGVIHFAHVPFNSPLYIMYSSGTTGVPKCIVHGAGGTLLKHIVEHRLHCDTKRDDRVFYFTTCGWMMWNWLVSALACEASLMLYDGSPFYPDGNTVFDFADAEKFTLLGTSAKFLDAAAKAGVEPAKTHSLASVRTLTSTGSPLAPEGFDYVYDKIKKDVHLASISGGTDIMGCFVLGDPTGPVWRGEIQRRGLGMAVDVFDDEGKPVRGEKGELVCTAPFPSMPLGFWNDPDGKKYHAAYFDKFPNIWCHGDYVLLTEHDGMVIHGRSDAVLNPGGVRIGTAEIYRQVERIPEVIEALVIGQDWDHDVRVVLFVVLRPGVKLDKALEDRIKAEIRKNTTPRHVPARIVQVGDIPRTRSGKITELAVREVVHGRPVKNREALANPEALENFRNRPELTA
jgi:acetoacetyl-CoA synthetase